MTDHDVTTVWPRPLTDHFSPERLLDLTSLSSQEVGSLLRGVAQLPSPLRETCRVILGDWDKLGGAERLAALVALAEAMASLNE